MEHAGRAYPAAIVKSSPVGLSEATERAPLDAELLAAGQAHVAEVARRAPDLHDGPVLALDRFDGGVLHARPSGYLAALATADALRAEWEREGMGPLRARVHGLAGADPINRGRGRAAAVGLAVVATFEGRALIGRRSEALAADPGLWHVVPSGMLEPGVDFDEQMEREMEEELIRDHVGARDLSGWHGEALGLGFDLLRLRPEMCWSAELDSADVMPGGEFDELVWLDPSESWPDDLTPAAAAALALVSGTLPGGQ